jgi:hypothetical protein
MPWHRVETEDFAAFEEPGYGKVVVAVSTFSSIPHRTLLTVHTRVQLTAPESWAQFRRCWRIAHPPSAPRTRPSCARWSAGGGPAVGHARDHVQPPASLLILGE